MRCLFIYLQREFHMRVFASQTCASGLDVDSTPFPIVWGAGDETRKGVRLLPRPIILTGTTLGKCFATMFQLPSHFMENMLSIKLESAKVGELIALESSKLRRGRTTSLKVEQRIMKGKAGPNASCSLKMYVQGFCQMLIPLTYSDDPPRTYKCRGAYGKRTDLQVQYRFGIPYMLFQHPQQFERFVFVLQHACCSSHSIPKTFAILMSELRISRTLPWSYRLT